MRPNDLVNPDTWQVETVKVDEMSCALSSTDALYLAFTSGKHLFMLERASVTTAQAHTCISPLGRRISLEWCVWYLLIVKTRGIAWQKLVHYAHTMGLVPGASDTEAPSAYRD